MMRSAALGWSIWPLVTLTITDLTLSLMKFEKDKVRVKGNLGKSHCSVTFMEFSLSAQNNKYDVTVVA